jgi:hypothetical protein
MLEVRSHADGLTPPDLWSGIALNPGARTVKWSGSAADRISDLLLAWWYVGSKEARNVDTFVKAVEAKVSDRTYPGMRKALQKLGKAMESPVSAAYADELDEEQLRKYADQRLRKILALAPHL